jgi:hypothetical protein
VRIGLIATGLLALASSAAAEVKSAGPTGFESENRLVVAATPAETWKMLGRIGEWWNKSHTYSGDSANLRLELKAGGCFCETLPARASGPAGSVQHGRVLAAMPYSMLVLEAPLGPLQSEAVSARLTWILRAVPGGTEVVQRLVAGGRFSGDPVKLAPLVDQVLAEQLAGLQHRLAR